MKSRSKALALAAALAVMAMAIVYFQTNAEAEVASFYRTLAVRNFSEAGNSRISTLKCSETDARGSLLGDRAFECGIETVCGNKIVSRFRYNILRGAHFGPDHFAESFARGCHEMLNEDALDWASANLDRGG